MNEAETEECKGVRKEEGVAQIEFGIKISLTMKSFFMQFRGATVICYYLRAQPERGQERGVRGGGGADHGREEAGPGRALTQLSWQRQRRSRAHSIHQTPWVGAPGVCPRAACWRPGCNSLTRVGVERRKPSNWR